MKLKKIAVSLMTFCCLHAYAANLVEKSSLTIDNIQVGKMDGDTKSSEFTTVINFRNNGDLIQDWKFGFFMERSFSSMASQNINPHLVMQICEAGGSCVNLRYVQNDSVTMNDLSNGWFTILEPIEKFVLKPKTNYYISLAHNNQWLPSNISSMPQSLFIMKDGEVSDGIPKIYTIATEASQYQLLNYDQNKVDYQTVDLSNSNWQNSLPIESKIVQIIPNPVGMLAGFSGDYTLPTKTLAIHNQLDTDNTIANLWAGILKQDWNIRKNVTVDNNQSSTTGIVIQTISDPRVINNNPEGYRLSIGNDGVSIEALTSTGVYYAFQTLRQIYAQSAKQTLPGVIITDYPRFKYRGLMLDTARHYFTVAEIKKLIDVMADQKLNTLHIHFADDEAFRLALPQYPTLAVTGANRGLGQSMGANMLVQNNLDIANLSQPQYPVANSNYGGSYSPTDIKEIVSYANANQITVIPEIDIPGHARALIKSFPQIMVDPNDNSQFTSIQGYSDNVLPVCTYGNNISVGTPFTNTLNDIVNSIASEFNSQTTLYAVNNEISVGGDEVSSHAWTNDTSCRDEWDSLSALDKSHLFFKKLAASNNSLMLSGWQQLVQTESAALGKNLLPSSQTGHLWVWNTSNGGIRQAVKLAQSNYPTVLAYADKAYLDQVYTPAFSEPGLHWANPNMTTYNALSMVKDVAQTIRLNGGVQNILGIEGALWSENLASFDHLMYMALPRMPALAEAAWSSENSVVKNEQLNWQDFATRLGCGDSGYLAYLNKQYKVNYRGYPNGIAKEVPQDSLCPIKSELTPAN